MSCKQTASLRRITIARRHHMQGFFVGSGIEIAVNPRPYGVGGRAYAAATAAVVATIKGRAPAVGAGGERHTRATGAPAAREVLLQGVPGSAPAVRASTAGR